MYGKLFAISALLGSTSAWSHSMATGCGDQLRLYGRQFVEFIDYDLTQYTNILDLATIKEASEFMTTYNNHVKYTITKKSKGEHDLIRIPNKVIEVLTKQ